MVFPRIPGFNSDDFLARARLSPARLRAARQVLRAMEEDPGPDDWGFPPSKEHPRPVVLIHGAFGNRDYPWTRALPLLRAAGYRVFRPAYGTIPSGAAVGLHGLGDTRRAAQELGAFVERVLSDTGAKEADLVGHSLGGVMPRYYINFLGGAEKVRNLVAVAPSSHGMTTRGLLALVEQIPGARQAVGGLAPADVSPACAQSLRGSPFQLELDAPGDTVDGVRYTVLWSACDEVVSPCESSLLSPVGPGHEVRNVLLQDLDPADGTTHMGMTYNGTVLREVLRTLDG